MLFISLLSWEWFALFPHFYVTEWTSCLICYILITSVDINFHYKLRGFIFIMKTIFAVSLRLFLGKCNWAIALHVGNTNPWTEHQHSSLSLLKDKWNVVNHVTPQSPRPTCHGGLFLSRGSSTDQTNFSSFLLHLGRYLVRTIRK